MGITNAAARAAEAAGHCCLQNIKTNPNLSIVTTLAGWLYLQTIVSILLPRRAARAAEYDCSER